MNGQEVTGGAAKADAAAVRKVSQRRMRVSLLLTSLLLVIYFGFLLLVAFAKRLLAIQLTSGLSLALALGALAIVSAWILTGIYVFWANRFHDAACDNLG
jgi:uncharacterized membrane protein (DUF485 family)